MTAPRHHASLDQAAGAYVARLGDTIIARSRRAKILREVNGEKTYPPVVYFPLEDVEQGCLSPSDRHSHCPIKGEASYYGIHAGSESLADAAWFYPEPLPMVAGIKGCLAFFPDKVTVEKA